MKSAPLPSYEPLSVSEPLSEEGQIALAMQPGKMSQLLTSVMFGAGHIPVTGSTPAACRILDMKYEPGEYCRILYEIGDDLVIGSLAWDETEEREADNDATIPGLGMQVNIFPHDPHIPTLKLALDPQVLADHLAQTLPECLAGDARILRCRVQPVRFRPGRRCTARVELWLSDRRTNRLSRRIYYAKIYHDVDKARHVYQEMQMVMDSPAIQQGPIGLAAAPYFIEDLAVLLFEPVAGAALDALLDCRLSCVSEQGLRGNQMAAKALAALHTAGLSTGRARPIEKELKRFKQRADRIAQVSPVLGQEISAGAQALMKWVPSLPGWGARESLVHGDCKPSQFLVGTGRAILLDFDHLGMGDPAGDVGTYTATLGQAVVQQAGKGAAPCADWTPQIRAEFLAAYQSASGEPPEFYQRAGWYEAVAFVRKAIRSFERSPASPLPSQFVRAAYERLGGLG